MTPRAGRARLCFAANLRRLRLELNLSQEELADQAELHRTYVGSVERGERNISIDNMERLANALHVPLEVLVAPSGAAAPSGLKGRRGRSR